MSIIEIVVLGLIQGMTEFIPVSSSGHLVLAQNFFSGASDHMFLEAINIGTFVALLVYFAPKIYQILVDMITNRQFALARNILITSVPAGIIGYLAADYIDHSPFFGSVLVVAVTLLALGIIMVVLDKLPHAPRVASLDKLSPVNALWVGFAQVLALVPGVSRSGSTIVAGRLLGFSARDAAEYSFLASLPVMAGVTLKFLLDGGSYISANLPVLLLSNLIAFLSGLFAVGFLMRYLSHHDLKVFGWYRIGLAALIIVVLLVQ